MAAVAESRPLSGRTSQAVTLERIGHVEVAPGVTVHRPTPDRDRTEPEPTGYLTATELAAITAAFKPLAENEAAQRETYEQAGAARYAIEPGAKAKLPALEAKIEALKAEHAKLRSTARLALLAALDAAAIRAGVSYRRACAMVADEAAELEGLARLRDELLGKATFDPLGVWQRASSLLAPPIEYRPRGWPIVTDVWGREAYFSAESPTHLEAVRRVQRAFRKQTTDAQAGAAFPF